MRPGQHLSFEQRQQWMRVIQARHPDIDPRSLRLMDDMRMVAHVLYQISEDSLSDSRLSYAQYRILQMLFFHEEIGHTEGLNPSEISISQGTGRNTVSGLIRSLEEDGLIERHLDPIDKRKFNIILSRSGRALVEKSSNKHVHAVNEIFRILSPEEMQSLSDLLRKLNGQAHEWRKACATGGNHASNE